MQPGIETSVRRAKGKTEMEMYSPDTLAKILDVTPQAIRNWIYSNRLPRVKIGNRVRIPADEVEKRLKRVKDGTGTFLD